MSLADMLTTYAEIIAQELAYECVDDIDPDKLRVLRYHAHAIPEDILCTKDGVLCVWWENIRPKSTTTPCPGFPVVILHAKWYTCWKEADVNASGKTMKVHYAENDADAGRLAEIAECITRRLMNLACTAPNAVSEEDDPLMFAFLQMADGPAFLDCTSAGALGAAASLHWRIQTGIFYVPTVPVPPAGEMFGRSATDGLGLDSP